MSGTPLGDYSSITGPEIQKILNEVVTQAYGPRVPMRRNPDNNND
jgi:hypothetical protein